ncbi:hypothetical protein ACH4NT_34025 [Streptomyces lydicus]|uniref:hypothetical protein n=1 Tax=Streptomyces lydicus TaxID=47763 RepID=UPI00378FDC48
MTLQVHFAILHCNTTESSFSSDKAVLNWDGQDFWNGRINDGEERNTDTFQLFPPGKQEALVSLRDEDTIDGSDVLGAQTIRRDELGQGWHVANFTSDDANYSLDYEVFEG